jgi:hypothetical protein
MADDFEIEIDVGGIDRVLDEIERDLEHAYGLAARNTAQEATNNTTRIDTGTMQNSWNDKQVGPLDYIVGAFGCAYAIFHEFGTRYLSASPMLIPAFERQRQILMRAIRALGKQWSRKYGDG